MFHTLCVRKSRYKIVRTLISLPTHVSDKETLFSKKQHCFFENTFTQSLNLKLLFNFYLSTK